MRVFVSLVVFSFSFALTGSPALAADVDAGKQTYQAMCASCHGAEGKGDGPAGAALDPKPRDFTDSEWQKSVTDEHIAKVTKEGGQAAGLSPLMPPWGQSLSDADVENVVAYVRTLDDE